MASLTCWAAVALAQTGVAVTGTVLDQNGAAVESVLVKAVNLASGRVATASTDSSGKYQLTNLPPGLYWLAAGREDFAAVGRRVNLGQAAAVEDFTLAPGIIAEGLTVTAGKGSARVAAETPQTVTVIGAGELEDRRPASVLEGLEKVPNLAPVSAPAAVARPRLRGLASNRLLLVLDGERLNNVRSDPVSGVSPGIIDVTQLESAEVVGSAGSGLYGSDALAGTINLVTRAPERAEMGQYLGLRFDGDLHSNGRFRRGAATLNWSVPQLALRLSGSAFRAGNYDAGGEPIALTDVVRLGQLATDLGNAIGNNVARTYGVWRLPAGAEVPNSQGHGFNDQADLWFFPRANHSLRLRQLNSQHKDLGFGFIAPPHEGRRQFNSFRRLDKTGLRYEGYELTPWLARLAGGFYRQKYSFADDNVVSTIDLGSSWDVVPGPGPEGTVAVLTGRPSTFTLGNFTHGKNTVTSYGWDLQATFIPVTRAVVVTGVGFLRDSSRDDFSRVEFLNGTPQPQNVTTGRASSPDSIYDNLSWFNLLEYEPRRWLRLTGGLRVDNWQTEARATRGFPLGTEAAIVTASLDQLIAEPGAVNVDGLRGITDLLGAGGRLSTDRTIVTGNVGAVVRLPAGVNGYFRWGNSFREPGITERYVLRNFGDPTFSVLLSPNTGLRPERGRSYDAGVKVQRARWNGSLGYFRNDLSDFIRPAFAPVLFVPADPDRGLLPLSPFFPFHGVLYVQRTNTARARIQGVEATYEADLSLGAAGVITPFGALGWLRGSDLTPDQNSLALIENFYNRPDTPVRLEGSADDVPLPTITPFRGVFGARYSSPRAAWFGEYQVRYQARVKRADPLELSAAIQTQYGTLASLSPFSQHSLRLGYTFRREDYRVSFTFGVENLTNRLYFEHFVTAPAPGRSFVFGVTMDLSNLLRR